MLQRQFEHAGQSHAPLTRSERTRALNMARKLHDRAVVDSLVLDATNHPSDGPLLPPKPKRVEPLPLGFESATNQLELRLAEQVARRPHRDEPVDMADLSACSRGVAVECLDALRHLGDSLAPVLAPTLRRIADSLEPIIMSTSHTDDDGLPLTHEQVCRGIMAPLMAEARARRDDAERERVAARSMLDTEIAKVAELKTRLENTGPQMLSLEARKSALEIELSGLRREIAELAQDNRELTETNEGVHDTRTNALRREVGDLKDASAALTQQVARLTVDLGECSTKEEYESECTRRREAEHTVEELRGLVEEQAAQIEHLRSVLSAAEKDRASLQEALDDALDIRSPRPDWPRLIERAASEAAMLQRLAPGGLPLLGAPSSSFEAEASSLEASPKRLSKIADGGGDGGGGYGDESRAESVSDIDGAGLFVSGSSALAVVVPTSATPSLQQTNSFGDRVDDGPSGGVRGPLHLGTSTASSASRLVDQLVDSWRAVAETMHRTAHEEAYFAHPGDSELTPIFLRMPPAPASLLADRPRLRNRKLPKREVEMHVREFWSYYYAQKKLMAAVVPSRRRTTSFASSQPGGPPAPLSVGASGAASVIASGPPSAGPPSLEGSRRPSSMDSPAVSVPPTPAASMKTPDTSPLSMRNPSTSNTPIKEVGPWPDSPTPLEQPLAGAPPPAQRRASLSLATMMDRTGRRPSRENESRLGSFVRIKSIEAPTPKPLNAVDASGFFGSDPPPRPVSGSTGRGASRDGSGDGLSVDAMFDAYLEQKVTTQLAERQKALELSILDSGGDTATALAATSSKLPDSRLLAVELALNLLDGCRRYNYDADLATFLDVVSYRVPAAAHASQETLQEQLKKAFVTADKSESNGRVTNEVKKASVLGVVRAVFPYAADDEVRKLLQALDKDVAGSGEKPVRYPDLFVEDADFNQSAFVEGCRAICLRAPREYVGQIEGAMREADVGGTGVVSWAHAASAIKEVDPELPDELCAKLVAEGFGEAAHGASIDIRVFCRRLLYAYPKRFGPPASKPLGPTPKGMRARRESKSSRLSSGGVPTPSKESRRPSLMRSKSD